MSDPQEIWDLREKFNLMSEYWWSAGWIINLEFYLWRDLLRHKANKEISFDDKHGHAPLCRDHDEYRKELEELEVIANKAGGWLFLDDANYDIDGTFLSWDEWKAYYEKNNPFA